MPVDGEISEKSYTPERFRDPQILSLLKKTTMKVESAFTEEWPQTFNCRIEIKDKSGKIWSKHLKNPKGHPANPMTDKEIEEKFFSLTRNILGTKQAQASLELLWHIEEVDDVGKIFDALSV